MRSLPGIIGVVVLAAAVATAAWLSFRPTEEPPLRPADREGRVDPSGTGEPPPLSPEDAPTSAPAVRNARVPEPEKLSLRTIEVLLAEKETARALTALERWAEKEPDNPRVFRLRGQARLDEQSWRAAEREYARALELEGEEATTGSLDGRAEALIRLRRTKEAAKLIERSLSLAPDRAGPHALLALGHLEAGRTKEAAVEIDKALAIEPDHPLANGLRKRLDNSPR